MKLQIINNPTCDNSITFHKTFEENLFPVLFIEISWADNKIINRFYFILIYGPGVKSFRIVFPQINVIVMIIKTEVRTYLYITILHYIACEREAIGLFQQLVIQYMAQKFCRSLR